MNAGRAVARFWAASLSVGLAAFAALAVLAHAAGDGGLAAASAVLGVSFVTAVVPGAVQLRAAAAATTAEPAGLHRPLIAGLTALLLLFAVPVADLLAVPALALVLVALQLPVACVASVQRGTAIGLAQFGRASTSMGVDAAVRLVAGAGLGLGLGATGLAAGLLLGTIAAALVGRGWFPSAPPAAAGAVLGPAASVGALMLLVNLGGLAAPRVLGPVAADAYAVAEVPAKSIFFALFALSWLAVPAAIRSSGPRQLLTPIAAVLGLGLAGTAGLAVAQPVLPLVLGAPAPTLALLVTSALAMAVGAALASALAMAVARGAWHPWAPLLAIAVAGLATVAATEPTAEALAATALAALAAALVATTAALLGTLGTARLAPVQETLVTP